MRVNFRSSTCASVDISRVLAKPGYSDQQTMPARQERYQQLIDDLILADDDLAYFTLDIIACGF